MDLRLCGEATATVRALGLGESIATGDTELFRLGADLVANRVLRNNRDKRLLSSEIGIETERTKGILVIEAAVEGSALVSSDPGESTILSKGDYIFIRVR